MYLGICTNLKTVSCVFTLHNQFKWVFVSGSYDFGEGGSEYEDFLHLEEFLNTAKEEDLFVILRTGPYICSEFNFGGFPSWLLREETMGFRTSEQNYMKYVTRLVIFSLNKF